MFTLLNKKKRPPNSKTPEGGHWTLLDRPVLGRQTKSVGLSMEPEERAVN